MRWFIRRRVWHLLEVVLVGSIPDDHLGVELCATFLAGLPVSFVALIEVICAEGVTAVVPATAVGGVREEDVLVLIVTNPVAAAFGLRQIPGFAAEPATWLVRLLLGWCFHLFLFRLTSGLTGSAPCALYGAAPC